MPDGVQDGTRLTETFRAEGITKVYETGGLRVEALRGVDLTLYEGELVVLLGPSGSGKSTLLNILGGLDLPTAGQLFFKDLELTACSAHDLTVYRRDHVGFVFQFYNLIPSLTARENVALVTEIAADPMSAAEALDKTSYPIFHDPRTGARATKLKMKDQKGVWGGTEIINFKPKPGTLIIFPGFLEHEFVVDHGIEPFRFIHWNIQAVPKQMAKDI